jgi:hypothetical protein
MFEIPQALPVLELCKCEAQELVITGKPSNPVVAVISVNAFIELVAWQMLKELCKDRPSRIHLLSSPISSGQTTDHNGQCKFKSEKTITASLYRDFTVLTVND